jgi:uncharacterized protein YndB with AHSA1/START domain
MSRPARSVTHSTIVIERTYDASPARVFAAWASREAKARWYACHDEWRPTRHELDFRVGGRETLHTGPAGGPVHAFDGVYQDIVPGERIVYTYEMCVGPDRISVSLATVELRRERGGTRMIFTEQIAILDGHTSAAEREEGTRLGLDSLDAHLRRAESEPA